jgi:hypothetical protein
MSDRELLELAAKAAGMDYTEANFAAPGEFESGWGMVENIGAYWNPLTDDGDALRLAVKLEIDIMYRVVGGKRIEVLPPGGPMVRLPYEGPAEEPTRRAIVMAAAEVARKKR